VRTDLWGRTDVPGLYATGEVACSGVHGANRLASNSLLEGLVFSRRIATALPGELRPWTEPAPDRRAPGLVAGAVRRELQEVMTSRVGVLRTADGLADAALLLDKLAGHGAEEVSQESWETTNLVTIAAALADAAALREETRGSHWREDFPERDDANWAGHFDTVSREGETTLQFRPSPATDHPA
jgi:L-aspartate oxidase